MKAKWMGIVGAVFFMSMGAAAWAGEPIDNSALTRVVADNLPAGTFYGTSRRTTRCVARIEHLIQGSQLQAVQIFLAEGLETPLYRQSIVTVSSTVGEGYRGKEIIVARGFAFQQFSAQKHDVVVAAKSASGELLSMSIREYYLPPGSHPTPPGSNQKKVECDFVRN